MKKAVLLLVFTLAFGDVNSQHSIISNYGSENETQLKFSHIVTDYECGYYVHGKMDNNSFIMRLDENLDTLWSVSFHQDFEFASFQSSIMSDTNGVYFFINKSISGNNEYAILGKLTKSGSLDWAKRINSNRYGTAQLMVSENVLFVASSLNNFVSLSLFKFQTDGNLIWGKTITDSALFSSPQPKQIIVCNEDSITLVSTSSIYANLSSRGSVEINLDHNGNYLSAHRFRHTLNEFINIQDAKRINDSTYFFLCKFGYGISDDFGIGVRNSNNHQIQIKRFITNGLSMINGSVAKDQDGNFHLAASMSNGLNHELSLQLKFDENLTILNGRQFNNTVDSTITSLASFDFSCNRKLVYGQIQKQNSIQSIMIPFDDLSDTVCNSQPVSFSMINFYDTLLNYTFNINNTSGWTGFNPATLSIAISKTSDCQITLANQLIIDETPRVSIYPNPSADGLFTVEGNKEIQQIKIFDSFGKLFQTYLLKNAKHSQQVNTLNLSSGLFIIQIHFSDGTYAFLKQQIVK
jgi:hypothetical protein